TIFERDHAAASAPWGEYLTVPETTLEQWRDELQEITPEAFRANNGALWEQWAFYDTASNERWRLYKVGTWLADRALQASGKSIVELRTMNGADIQQLLS